MYAMPQTQDVWLDATKTFTQKLLPSYRSDNNYVAAPLELGFIAGFLLPSLALLAPFLFTLMALFSANSLSFPSLSADTNVLARLLVWFLLCTAFRNSPVAASSRTQRVRHQDIQLEGA